MSSKNLRSNTVTVGLGGLVSNSEVDAKDPRISSDVAQCIATVVRRLQFSEPPDGTPVRVSYPFGLEPPDPASEQ